MLTPDKFETHDKPETVKVQASHIGRLVDSLTFIYERVGGTTTTGCWALLPNGYQVGYGESACVDPNEYDQAKGEMYARERCIQAATHKLWDLEGYLLKVTGFTSDRLGLEKSSSHIPVGFSAYRGLPTTRYAYQVKESDVVTYVKDSTAAIVMVDGEEVQFKHYEEVKPGDYIVYLKEHDIYHCSQEVFNQRNIT